MAYKSQLFFKNKCFVFMRIGKEFIIDTGNDNKTQVKTKIIAKMATNHSINQLHNTDDNNASEYSVDPSKSSIAIQTDEEPFIYSSCPPQIEEKQKFSAPETIKSTTKEFVKEGRNAAAATQARKSAAKEIEKEEGKVKTTQATMSADKEVVKEGGKVTVAQVTKSVAKEIVKEREKATATQATESTGKEVVKEVTAILTQ